uniref:Uncharacterized protein n=1 Tax=Arundo donax TaxID=35708 RepID=A0A0A8YZ04_ARUDO
MLASQCLLIALLLISSFINFFPSINCIVLISS